LMSPSDMEKRRSILTEAIKPDNLSVFPEFKNQSTKSLGFTAERTLRRWSLWNAPPTMDFFGPTKDKEEEKGDPASSKLLSVLIYVTNEFETWIQYVARNEGDQQAIAVTITNSLSQARQTADKARSRTNSGFLSPALCIRRTFWPF
jgi:hypothetical protein